MQVVSVNFSAEATEKASRGEKPSVMKSGSRFNSFMASLTVGFPTPQAAESRIRHRAIAHSSPSTSGSGMTSGRLSGRWRPSTS